MKKNFNHIPTLILLSILIINFSLIFFTHNSWDKSIQKTVPLKNELATIKNKITEGHLWLEELLGGDQFIDIQSDIISNFDHKDYSQFVRNLQEYKSTKEKLQLINSELSTLNTIVKERLNQLGNHGIGSSLDQEFDKIFIDILKRIDNTNLYIDKITKEELANREKYFILTILLFLVLNLFVLLLLHNYKIKQEFYKSKLTNLNTTLEEQVEKKTKNLNDKIDYINKSKEIMIKNEKILTFSNLISEISEELNSPVSKSCNLIKQLQAEATKFQKKLEKNKISQNNSKEYLEKSIQIHSTLASNLIQTLNLLKSFEKISSKKSNKKLECLPLLKHTEDLIETFKKIKKYKKIKFYLLCKENICLKLDLESYNQLITNLFLNSYTHGFQCKNGGDIDITIWEDISNTYIRFADSGTGIDSKNIKKIYDPFFTTNKKNGSNGLGLYTVYNIVDNLLFGTIECTSNKNSGTAFKITIPKSLDQD